MAGITLVNANEQLTAWLAASLAVSNSQEYWLDGRKLVRADLAEIQKQILFWNNQVISLTNGGQLRSYRTIPRDN